MRYRLATAAATFAATTAALVAVPSAPPVAAAQPLVIQVDHTDSANQQPFPPFNRLFEYTDFFSRNVRVHQGDVIDFQTQPFTFHIVALAKDESAALRAYPVLEADKEGGGAGIAAGTGKPNLIFGPSNNSITGGSTNAGGTVADNGQGPPVCGVAALGQAPCTFRGGEDVEVIGPTPGFDLSGQPATIDQDVVINAPPGRYSYFDTLHPAMNGTLTVVSRSELASTQAQIDAASAAQFTQDQSEALTVEQALNQTPEGIGPAGHRQFVVFVGAGAPDGHVQIDEMFPDKPLGVLAGDKVNFVWDDPRAVHSVAFPANDPRLPEPFGYDCGSNSPGYQSIPGTLNVPLPPGCLEPGVTQPEVIGDPGNAPSGTELSSPASFVDAGVRAGVGFHVHPSSQQWAVTVGPGTAAGTYTFQCTVHAWMTGVITVG